MGDLRPLSVARTETVDVAYQRHRLEAALFGIDEPVRIGRYALRGRLGEGGMGAVYEAYDPELDRTVAIKVLHDRHTRDDRASHRLVREATSMARLSDPHVVQVFEVGEHGGEVFIAMEHVDGVPMDDWLESPRTVKEIVEVFIDAGRGLAAAHAADIIHRDFKPQNVLIDRRGWAKVMDFGLAGQLDGDRTDPPERAETSGAPGSGSFTRTGALLGTPQYMSPEQHRGRDVGPKSDQWNYCAALFEALHGKVPFEGKTMEQLWVAVDEQRIEPRDRRVPAWLDAIARRGLQPDPDARFGSMHELVAALQRGPRRIAWRLAVPVVAIGAVGVAVAMRPTDNRCEGADARLEGIWDDARKDEILAVVRAAEGPASELSQAFDDYAQAWISTHTSACEAHLAAGDAAGPVFDATMQCLRERRASLSALVDLVAEGEGGGAPAVLGASASLPDPERCLDEDYLQQRDPVPDDPRRAAAHEAARETLAGAAARGQAADRDGARSMLDDLIAQLRGEGRSALLAEALTMRGRLTDSAEEAVPTLDEAYWMAEGIGDWNLAYEAAVTLVQATGGGLEQHDEGLRWASYARAALKRQGKEPDTSLLTFEAMILEGQGKLDEAIRGYEAALATQEALADPDSVRTLFARSNLGDLLSQRGRHTEALEQLRHAHRVLVAEYGADSAKAARAEALIGDTLRRAGDPQAALAHHRNALDAVAASPDMGPDHANTAHYRNKLVQSLAAVGRHDEALEQARRAQKVLESAYGPQHPMVALTDALLGEQFHALQQYDDALRHLQRAQATFEAALPAEHEYIPENRERIARVYVAQEDFARALPIAREVLDAFVRIHGEVSPDVARARFMLARSLWGVGEHAEAREQARRARDRFDLAGGRFEPRRKEAEAWLAEHAD